MISHVHRARFLLLGLLLGVLVQVPAASAVASLALAQPVVVGLLGGLYLHHRYGLRTAPAGGAR